MVNPPPYNLKTSPLFTVAFSNPDAVWSLVVSRNFATILDSCLGIWYNNHAVERLLVIFSFGKPRSLTWFSFGNPVWNLTTDMFHNLIPKGEMYLSVVNFIAEVFGLPTKEMYEELLNDYFEMKQKYEEAVLDKHRSKTPYIKVEENIFRYFNKYIVRTVHKKKRYTKSFDTIEEARNYLTEVKKIG